MDFTSTFVDLYGEVLSRERQKFYVSDHKIREAIRVMKEVYKPNPGWQHDQTVNVADYNDPAHRMAYVHKHAPCYTGLVYKILKMAVDGRPDLRRYFQSKKRLYLCSLGGGPGTDVVGAMAFVYAHFQYIPCDVRIVDYFKGWKTTFALIVQELRCGHYGGLSSMVSSGFGYDYLDANLLSSSMWNKLAVRQTVCSADLITMVKFVSAAASEHTRQMIEQVFKHMKPGALLFFIDNAGGGFQRIMQQAANQCGMVSVFGPLQHYDYEVPAFSITRFGYTSQSKTKVCAQMWQKPVGNPYNTSQQLRNEYYNQPRAESGHTIRIDRPPARRQSGRTYREEREEETGCCTIM